MASEIRVDKITSLSGVGTITPSSSGIDITGITTVATLKATTGIVTTLTATTGIVTTLTANTVTSLGAVSGTTGTFSGDVDIADTIVHTGDTNTKIRFPAADTVTVETGGSERIRVDSNGNMALGIAGAVPTNSAYNAACLHINQATNNSSVGAQIHLTTANSGTTASDGTQISQYDNTLYINNQDSGTIQLFTGGSERLRIDGTGRVLIGAQRTYDTGTYYDDITINNSNTASGAAGGAGLSIVSGDSSYGGVIFSNNSTHGLGYMKYNMSANELIFGSSSNNRLYITSSGDVDVEAGDIFFSTAGKGIVLGATSNTDANTLDDYEEGTFTPTYSFSSSTGTFTYDAQIGRYTKIGNRCFFSVIVRSTGHSGTSNGLFRIASLPFNVLSDAPSGGTCFFITGGNFSANYGVATQLVTTEHIEFYKQVTSTGNNYDSIEENELNLGGLFVKVEGHYQVDQ